jgi:hypothetical protein
VTLMNLDIEEVFLVLVLVDGLLLATGEASIN